MDRLNINEAETRSHSSTLEIHSTLTVPLRRYANMLPLTVDLSPDFGICSAVVQPKNQLFPFSSFTL